MVVITAPEEEYDYLKANLPENELTTTTTVEGDAVIFYASTLTEVTSLTPHAVEILLPGGIFWIAYPKSGTNMVTEINRDRLVEAIQPAGWQAVRMVDLGEKWSAIRFQPQGEAEK